MTLLIRSGALAVAFSSWLDVSGLFDDRSFRADFDEVRILTGTIEILASCVGAGLSSR